MIVLYNAIAGACAEDKANAGAGSPPAGVTLNQIYFSDSSTSGAGAGALVKIYRNSYNFLTGASGVGTDITGLTQNVGVSQINATTTGSTYTLPAANLSAFFAVANLSGEEVWINLATFLQAPNGLNSLTNYEIVSVATTSTGIGVFSPAVLFGATLKAATFPLQNSLTIGNDYPANGVSGNWGILGTGALGSSFGGGVAIDIPGMVDLTARGGSISAGDTITIVYTAEGVNSSGATENTFHQIGIILS